MNSHFFLLAVCCLLFPLRILGASVEWNGFWYQPDEYASSMTAGPNGGRAFISWWNEQDTLGNLIWVVDAAPYMEIACAWMTVHPGDFIDEAFVRNCDSYFYKWGIFGEELRADYDIVFPPEGEVWLGVAVSSGMSQDEVLYGWVQFHQEGNGNVNMVTSALNVEGKGILVGGGSIPEPSSGLLLLLGGAVLGLRRQKMELHQRVGGNYHASVSD